MNRIQQIISSFCLLGFAQLAAAHPTSIGYLYDTQGTIVHAGSGGCIRTAEWTPANALAECDDVAKPTSVAQPVAATPKTAIKPAAVQAVPSTIQIELSADESFEPSKAELRAETKAKLSQLVKELQGLNYDQIVITGHADRTGPAAANQRLSERRAIAAHNYLVSEGIPASKMQSSGKGSSQPITKPGDCAGLKHKELAACLAPDRRMEIRISGTRTK